MPNYDAGTASIKVKPSFKTFITEARSELRQMDLSVDARVGADTTAARADFEELRVELRAMDFVIDAQVNADTAAAKADLERLRAEAKRDVELKAEADVAAAEAEMEGFRKSQERRPVKVPVEADRSKMSSARAEIGKMASELASAGSVNLKVLGVVGAGAAISQLLAIADAAAQAAHAVALIPAIGFAGLAGIGSAAVGIKGLPDVFKAMSQESSGATEQAHKHQDALFDVSEAQYRLTQAQSNAAQSSRDYLRSQQDLNTAYRDGSRSLRDMNDQLVDQKLATEDASLGVEEAAKRLQQVQFDPTADSTTRRRAQLGYQEAVQRLKEQQTKTQDLAQDTAEANAKGVEGSSQVVAAKDKVTAAAKAQAAAEHEIVTAAEQLRRAQEQANESGGGGSNKLADAMAKLSPNAKELVTDIKSLGPAWTEARKAGQDALTDHMGADILHLSSVQLPNLRAGIVGINTAWNTGLRGVLESLSSDTNKADFSKTLTNTAVGFAGAAAGAKPFTDAMTKLVTVGSDFLPQMGVSVDQMAIKFDRLIQRTAADGSLKRWIQEGLTSGRELVEILEHVGSAIGSVFRAAGNNGAGLKSLDDLTAKMANFLKSAEGQQKLGKFFAELHADGQQLVPLLQELPGLLHAVMQGFSTWSDIATPFLKVLASLLTQHPQLVEAAVVAYVGFKTVAPIVNGATKAIDLLAARTGEAGSDAKGLGKLRAAGAGLLGVLGNPWTIGLAAAGAAVLSFEDSARKGADAVQRFHQQSLQAVEDQRALQKAVGNAGGKLDTSVIDAATASIKGLRQAAADNGNDLPGFADNANAAFADIGNSLFGVGGGVVADYHERLGIGKANKAMSEAFDKLGLANDQLAQKVTGSKPEFDALVGRLNDMGQGGQNAASKLEQLRDEWAMDVAASAPVSAAIQALSDKNRDAATSIDAATQAMERQRKGSLTLEEAQVRVTEAFTAMQNGSSAASGALVDANGNIDLSNQKGVALWHLINDQLAPAWEQLTNATYRQAIQSGKTATEAQADSQRAADAMKTSAEQSIESMGFSQAQADELLRHYKLLNGDYKATATLDTSQAMTALQQYTQFLDNVAKTEGSIPGVAQFYALQLGLPEQYHPDVNPARPPAPGSVPNPLLMGSGRAEGGRLPTSGPGTNTTDGILGVDAAGMPTARVDAGEWIIKRRNAEKYDRELSEINAGTFPKLPGYADGGVAGQQPGQSTDKAAAARQLDQFAQSRSGQPYGGDEDCSGFISELANVAVGLPPKAGRMGTANEGEWLAAHGFQTGSGGYGAFRVGWVNDPSMPAGGHTAGTLPSGVNVESGGATGTVMYGGAAIGANNPMFTQHAYLQMLASGPATPGVGGLAGTSPETNTQPVLYPQAPLPGRMSEQQLQKIQNQSAVDAANSERNRVYADPNSTDADKRAADYKYLQAQNTLQSGNGQQDSDLLSAQGIGARAGSIIAGGLLSMFGLENSIFSSSNVYNRALTGIVNQYGGADALLGGNAGGAGGYSYTPQNLPSMVTTVTPQSSAPVTDPANQNAIPAAPGVTPPAPGNATSSSGGVKDVAKQQMAAYGWDSGPQWSALDQLVDHESSWNPTAQNPTSTAYGLYQFLDQTWATVGGSKTSDPSLQSLYGARYIADRYGNPAAAWAFWQAQSPHWYDDGGIADGIGFLTKNVLKPERVLSPRQTETFDSALPLLESINSAAWSADRIQPHAFGRTPAAGGGGGYTFSPVVNARVADVGDLVDRVAREGDKHAIGQMAALPV